MWHFRHIQYYVNLRQEKLFLTNLFNLLTKFPLTKALAVCIVSRLSLTQRGKNSVLGPGSRLRPWESALRFQTKTRKAFNFESKQKIYFLPPLLQFFIFTIDIKDSPY